jgi:hypothetical protein
VPRAEEEIYSTMFRSLKHPARRKILRMIADKPMSFSQLQEELAISSSYLTYHLESLGQLLSKEENGTYKLSAFGLATINTMKTVEETPESVQPKKSPTKKWKMLVAVMAIAVILVSSFSVVEFGAYHQASSESALWQLKYNQLISVSTNAEKAITFLDIVVQLDTSHYQSNLLSRNVENRENLGDTLEEILTYSLTSSDSKLQVVFRFRDNQLSKYQLITIEGEPVYSTAQPSTPIQQAKGFMQRLSFYEYAPYLQNMTKMLDTLEESAENLLLTQGNLKLNTTSVGEATQFVWVYTENNIDFSPKTTDVVFANQALTDFIDDMYLFTVGSTSINVSADQAVATARDALKTFSWTANGEKISDLPSKLIDKPPTVYFHPNTRGSVQLYPYWVVTFTLNKVYPDNVNAIVVGVWADNPHEPPEIETATI